VIHVFSPSWKPPQESLRRMYSKSRRLQAFFS
jgi:hypothetical protein